MTDAYLISAGEAMFTGTTWVTLPSLLGEYLYPVRYIPRVSCWGVERGYYLFTPPLPPQLVLGMVKRSVTNMSLGSSEGMFNGTIWVPLPPWYYLPLLGRRSLYTYSWSCWGVARGRLTEPSASECLHPFSRLPSLLLQLCLRLFFSCLTKINT